MVVAALNACVMSASNTWGEPLGLVMLLCERSLGMILVHFRMVIMILFKAFVGIQYVNH